MAETPSEDVKTLRATPAGVYADCPVPVTPLEQLLAAISDVRIRKEALALIKLSAAAVDDLSQIDERIYQHHTRNAGVLSNAQSARPVLVSLAEDVLRGVRDLEKHLQEHAKETRDAAGESKGEDFDFDFATGVQDSPEDGGFGDEFDDFGGFGDSSPAPPSEEPSLADIDLDDAFDMLGQVEPEKSCLERWRSLLGELESFAYGLGSQIRDFDERFADALGDGRFQQALRELNDVGRSVTDGVFALMTAIYEAYLDEVDRDGVLPGHKSTLAKALAVRSGLTDLGHAVHAANAILQSGDAGDEAMDGAFTEIVFQLDDFVRGDVFAVMRPSDRLELVNFLRVISGKTRNAARFDCEGLDKYLDSLSAVSQRDVLIKHDADQKEDILDLLEAVKPLLDISPRGSLDLIEQAFGKAGTLYGVRPALDSLLVEWSEMAPSARSNLGEAARMSQQLDERIREIP